MRFRIRTLLLTMVASAFFFALIVFGRSLYYSDRLEHQLVLRQVNDISYDISTVTDVVEEVSQVDISIDGRPGSRITLSSLGDYQTSASFGMLRIGKWRFVISGCRHVGAYNEATGEPVESDYFGSSIVLGPDSAYNEVLPFKVQSLQDLVDHYQDLVELFDSWPREADPGRVTLRDGSVQYYYVVDESK